MDSETITIVTRLSLAVLAGGIIGLERSFHGRPAGFRTHTLVCAASSLLMLLMVFQLELIAGNVPLESINIDPTRMAQGIMTGIGFLGAGVIIKENYAIRGLTTAGSIWMTASIGIVIGMGFYLPAFLATMITLGALVGFRWIENILPVICYSRLTVLFQRKEYMPEQELYPLLRDFDIKPGNASYTINHEGKTFEYQLTIRTNNRANFSELAVMLGTMELVQEFSITPIGD